jgi:hypothetical protein
MASKLRSRIHRPSHATVVAYLALFIAAGGGGIAVADHLRVRSSDIVDGQVKAPDIRGGAVGSSKVKNDSLTGEDIRESSLGTVNNSRNLGSIAASAYQRRCAPGAIWGFTYVRTDQLPANRAWQNVGGYNCTGGSVQARTGFTRGYVNVRFVGNPAVFAQVTAASASGAGRRAVPNISLYRELDGQVGWSVELFGEPYPDAGYTERPFYFLLY